MKNLSYPTQALLDPLDIDAVSRLIRLNVLTPNGKLNCEGLKNIAKMIGYDMYDLLKYWDLDIERMITLLLDLDDCETQYLFLCLIYEDNFAGVPYQLPAIAPYKPALAEFMTMFVSAIEDLTETDSADECDELLVAAVNAEVAKHNLENHERRKRTIMDED